MGIAKAWREAQQVDCRCEMGDVRYGLGIGHGEIQRAADRVQLADKNKAGTEARPTGYWILTTLSFFFCALRPAPCLEPYALGILRR